MAWLGIYDAVAATVRNVLRKPVTVQYPTEQRARSERYRASFALTLDEHGEPACVACMMCEKICPSQVIKVKPGVKRESPATGKKRLYADDFTLDLSACLQCELCVQVCGSDAIQMVREPERPAFSREDLFLSMERLYENNKNKTAAWANGSRLIGMQEPPKPAPKPAAPAPGGGGGSAPITPVAAAPEKQGGGA
jgi:NADH-quinone oxidoreductase subunit I